MGGEEENFPKTTFHLVCGLKEESLESRSEALERLCRRYWKPVYVFIRRARAKSNEDAKDLAQAFFLWALERDRLSKYESARGTFRNFLKLLLKGFLSDSEDSRKTLKRGGAVRIVPLEAAPEVADVDPDLGFDRHWKLQVIKRALVRVKRWCAESGRDIQFQAFREYQVAPDVKRPTYAEVARRLNISESDVRNHLHSVRSRLQEALRAEVADTVTGPSELESEWASLFGRA